MTTWAPVVRRHRRLQAVGLFVRLSALGTTLAVVLLGAASVSPALPWATAAVLVIVAVGFHVYFFVSNDVIDLPVDRPRAPAGGEPAGPGDDQPGGGAGHRPGRGAGDAGRGRLRDREGHGRGGRSSCASP